MQALGELYFGQYATGPLTYPIACAATQPQSAACIRSRTLSVAAAATQAQTAACGAVLLHTYWQPVGPDTLVSPDTLVGPDGILMTATFVVRPAATQAQAASTALVHVVPPPRILPVVAPISPAGTLGCGFVRAEVRVRGVIRTTQTLVLDLPNITSVEWTRVRSDTSEANVKLDGLAISADPACCATLSTIHPWEHELYVYRDDALVWLGPIVEMTLDGATLEIKARDLSAWLDRRFIHSNIIYGGTSTEEGSADSADVFQEITLDGFAPLADMLSGNLFVKTSGVYDMVQRAYAPAEFKPAAPELRALAKSTLEWTVTKRNGTVGNGPSWKLVSPNPVTNPTFDVNTTGWTGMTRDTGISRSGGASGRTGSPPNATGSIVGLEVGGVYCMRCWVRGTASALDALQVPNMDGVVSVGPYDSSIFSWYVYKQATTPDNGDPGRVVWAQLGVYFIATATTMPITITATGNPIDSHGIYFDDFDVLRQVPSFTLRDDALAQPPKITKAGLDQVNHAVVAGKKVGGDYATYGEYPAWVPGGLHPVTGLTAAMVKYGVLERVATQPYADAANLQASATSRVATLDTTPLVLDSLVLSPQAGVTIDDLIPGTVFTVILDEPCFAVNEVMVIETVKVTTTPTAGEVVTITMQPAGF